MQSGREFKLKHFNKLIICLQLKKCEFPLKWQRKQDNYKQILFCRKELFKITLTFFGVKVLLEDTDSLALQFISYPGDK